MESPLQDRLVAMEMRLAHFERMADDLSEVVTHQAQTIDALKLQIRQLQDRFSDMALTLTHPAQDDPPPPHY